MTIITFAHHKGGTGKTTSCLSIAGALRKMDFKVLVIDCDPQANATSGLGIDPDAQEKNMYDVFMNVFEGFPDVSMKDIIIETKSGISLAPSSLDLVGVEPYLYSINERSELLKDAVKPILADYDFILIDTPPSMGQFVINGIIAADKIVLTMDSSRFAKIGLESMNCIFDDIKENVGKDKSPSMALITRAGPLLERKKPFDMIKIAFHEIVTGEKAEAADEERQNTVEKEISEIIPAVMTIPHDTKVFAAQNEGMPLEFISPESPAAVKYREAAEIMAGWK